VGLHQVTFSDQQHDLKWLQTTSLPSARDESGTNATFKSFFDQHQELTLFARTANAIPPLKNPKFTDIQTALGDDAVIPVVKGQATPDQAWNKLEDGSAAFAQLMEKHPSRPKASAPS